MQSFIRFLLAGACVMGVVSGCASSNAGAPGLLSPGGQPSDAKAPASLDTATIEKVTGLKGTMFDKEPQSPVFKVTQARTDLPITVEGRKMEPFMGFTSWAGFRAGAKNGAMVAGDLVLMQDEVSPVMDALFANGCTVTALHNHFAFDEPRVMFMHIGGEGTEEQLAKGVRAALDAVEAVRTKSAPVASRFEGADVPTANTIIASKLDAVFFSDGKARGAASNGMYKATFGREVSATCGCVMGKELGVNTWAAFCGSDDVAAVDGDFITFAGELQPVLKSLRKGGINVVAIHSHMEGETPGAIFLHYWGKGKPEELARGVKAAMDAQAAASHK